MATIQFIPNHIETAADPGSKLLSAAIKAKTGIRYGCGACRCGTCGVRITEGAKNLSDMSGPETALLGRMKLSLDGEIRLACQARITGDEQSIICVDLDFQNQYSPDTGLEDTP